MTVTRWTPLLFVAPRHFVEQSQFWGGVNFQRWSDKDYTWAKDDWNGIRNFAQDPRHTFEQGEGDCEDYALVAACVHKSKGNHDLAFVMVSSGYVPEHIVLYDRASGTVYSSGKIHEKSLEEYLAWSKYERVLARRRI